MRLFNSLLRLFVRNKLPMTYQTETATCGLACLAMVMGYYNKKVTITSIQDNHPVSLKGITLKQIVSIANRYRLITRPIKCGVGSLKSLKTPTILHWDFNHFVVLKSVRRGNFFIHDPDLGPLKLNREEMEKHFTGIALEITPEDEFTLDSEGNSLGIKWIIKNTVGVRSLLINTIWLTFIIELIALSSPLFIKYSIDFGVERIDENFILVITAVFLLILIFNVILNFMRDYITAQFGVIFNKNFVRKLFSHMLSLPLSFFEKRNTGELIERYQSTEHVRNLLTGNVVNIILNGSISIGMSIAIFFISPVLGTITLASFLIYFLFRLVAADKTERKMKENIKARAHETSLVIETLRSISPIKTFSKEEDRLNIWLGRYSKLMMTEMSLTSYLNFQKSMEILIFGLDISLSVYYGTHLVMTGALSLGTLFAFFMYKGQFSIKASSLTSSLIDLKYFSVHLERLADIVLSKPEESKGNKVLANTIGKIELKNIYYSYAIEDDLVFNDLNMTVNQGEFISIVGNSGSGKTTLLKVILGLYKPDSGSVLLDNEQAEDLDMSWYRKQFGIVMQEDQLISASIVDNISFQDPWADFDKVQQAAIKSNIHDEIMKMPMQYNTIIGDLGSTLSGGQKQRILLARALYQDPKILFTDEATANLDSENEITVLNEIEKLNLTRVCIAHRPQTIMRSDRVLLLKDGKITEISKDAALNNSAQLQLSSAV
ncbi:peptidase domain-containing ABC transporter [Shewanella sp. 10N.286.45.A1]|uniref:peptidase domain-containing ABC transporter n=1 Tax=Shewanella sp. 10N.286.45.A1 TaxID=3229694 RepID=UPI00354B4269